MDAILSALHPRDSRPERSSQYDQFEHELKFGNIKFPVKTSDIKKFEQLNPSLSINAFGHDANNIFPVYLSIHNGENEKNKLIY